MSSCCFGSLLGCNLIPSQPRLSSRQWFLLAGVIPAAGFLPTFIATEPFIYHPDRACDEGSLVCAWQEGWLGAHRPWAYPCDRSHGCHLFQRSHNSLTLRQVLSVSENDGSHKRALIDRKGKPRVYMDYCSIRLTLFWYADVSDFTHSYSAVLTLSFGRTHSVIPTAVEGSHPVGTRLFYFTQAYRFGY